MESAVLGCLRRRAGATVLDLSRLLRAGPDEVAKTVRGLGERGLVKREGGAGFRLAIGAGSSEVKP